MIGTRKMGRKRVKEADEQTTHLRDEFHQGLQDPRLRRIRPFHQIAHKVDSLALLVNQKRILANDPTHDLHEKTGEILVRLENGEIGIHCIDPQLCILLLVLSTGNEINHKSP